MSNVQFITATTSKSDLAGCTQKISGTFLCVSLFTLVGPDPDKKKELSKEKSGRSCDGGIKEKEEGEGLWKERKRQQERILHERAAGPTFLSPTFAAIQLKRLQKSAVLVRVSYYSRKVSLLRRLGAKGGGEDGKRCFSSSSSSSRSSSSTLSSSVVVLYLSRQRQLFVHQSVNRTLGRNPTRNSTGTVPAYVFLRFRHCNPFPVVCLLRGSGKISSSFSFRISASRIEKTWEKRVAGFLSLEIQILTCIFFNVRVFLINS